MLPVDLLAPLMTISVARIAFVSRCGQALGEKADEHADNGVFQETLNGALIGADSDR